MPLKKSLYEVAEHSRDQINNQGFDYQGKIFQKTMSNLLFAEDKRAGFLASLEAIFYELIQRVKIIKVSFDFAKKKNSRTFN